VRYFSPGMESHFKRVAVDVGRLLLGEEALLSRIDRLRRVKEALGDCEKLIKLVRSAAARAR
jgi:hypothetical protein